MRDGGERIALFALRILFMFLGTWFYPHSFNNILSTLINNVAGFKNEFYWMILAGFLAQLVDGAVGYGYGVTSTTILLSIGVNLPAISGSVHTAEFFRWHFRVQPLQVWQRKKKLFKRFLIPVCSEQLQVRIFFQNSDGVCKLCETGAGCLHVVAGCKNHSHVFRKNTERPK